jgi:hypothetical protein
LGVVGGGGEEKISSISYEEKIICPFRLILAALTPPSMPLAIVRSLTFIYSINVIYLLTRKIFDRSRSFGCKRMPISIHLFEISSGAISEGLDHGFHCLHRSLIQLFSL